MTEREVSNRPELSALLDGELSAIEEAALQELLANNVALRLELRAVEQVRSALRGLDPVEIPEDGFLMPSNVVVMRRPRRFVRRRAFVGSVAAAVAAWMFLVVTVAPTPASADPIIEGSVEAHRASIENLPGRSEAVQTPNFPKQMGGELTLQFVSRHGQQIHALYASETQYVSVFQQPGTLEWDKLPAGGSLIEFDSLQAWTWDDADIRVVVLERDEAVFTFVSASTGESPLETTAMNASVLPEKSGSSVWSRVTGACHDAARLLGFG